MLNLFNPSYLKQLCFKYGLSPSKKYGQNFLIHPEPIGKMIEAAELVKDDTVVEIGPGFGALTFALAEKAGKVAAFEIEKKLKPYWDSFLCHSEEERSDDEESLSQNFKIETEIPHPFRLRPPLADFGGQVGVRNDNIRNIEIVWGNVLRLQTCPPCFWQGNGRRVADFGLQNYKVVANLPYQITSQIIRYFLEAENKPELMVLMAQKEVAERICARPGEMSVLSVAVQYYARPEIIINVPRTYFWPEPKVDSAVIKLKVYKVHKVEEERNFFQIVKAGFANKRKLLIKNLAAVVGKENRGELENIFMKLSLLPTTRAQELSIEQWQELAEELSTRGYIC